MRQLRLSFVCVTTALASAALVAAASAQTTITLNDPNTQVVYTSLRAGAYANKNQGHDLQTKTAPDASVVRRAIIKFDTQNTIPAGSIVSSATMTIMVKESGATSSRHIAAYQMTQSWDESEATWNVRRTNLKWQAAGGDLGTKLGTQAVGSAAGTKVVFDVTPLVAQAVAGKLGSSRYTRIALVDVDPADGESRRIYYTPDDSNVAARPKLTVTYGGKSAPAPSTSSSSGGGTTLHVLQYNVHHNGIGTDGRNDPNRIADWVAKINADVVSLVEVESWDSYYSGDGAALYKKLLEARTGATWHTLDIQKYGDWSSPGQRDVILSKYPFSSSYRYEFSTGDPRTVGGVTISVNGRIINFMSNHLDWQSGSRRATQSKELVSYANGFAENRILVGDFNDQPTSTPLLTLLAKYYDGWTEAKKAGTAYSAPDNPNGYTRNSRIDDVLYSRGETNLTLKSIQVIDTRDGNGNMPSDHRPLLATFTVK
jgi:endonuclease/exonuclease/phosphatase family metal-dependent hydrolase